VQLKVLGSAAGGGFPQWNCGCVSCRTVRQGGNRALPRRQSSLAVRGSSGYWHLVNASPDVREQLESLRDPHDDRLRSNPIASVILTDAEIDHTAGLIILRESAQPLDIYGTPAVEHALRAGFPVLEVLDRYCGVRWHTLDPDGTFELQGEGTVALEVETFAVPGDPPLHMRGRKAIEEGLAIGLVFRDPESGGVATYAPAVGELDARLLERFEASDVILVDGTFWRDDELPSQGIGIRTALDMGHLPLSGAEGMLARLRHLEGVRKVLIHINNSNPILLENSPEREMVEEAGFEVAHDGMLIEI